MYICCFVYFVLDIRLPPVVQYNKHEPNISPQEVTAATIPPVISPRRTPLNKENIDPVVVSVSLQHHSFYVIYVLKDA